MKIFIYALLWIVIFVIAVVTKVFLGDFLDGVVISKAIKSLIAAIPTGVYVGIGVALQHKVKEYSLKENTHKHKMD